MKKIYFNKVIGDPISLFEENIIWDENDYIELRKDLNILLDNFLEEIENNIFAKKLLEKEDIIRGCIVEMAEIKNNILIVNYDDNNDDEFNCGFPDSKAIKIFNEFYNDIIDRICYLCLKHSIELDEMIRKNFLAYEMFDISIYKDLVKESLLKKNTTEEAIKTLFKDVESYNLFCFLIKKFDTTPLNKISCIYRLMHKDGNIREDVRPERFKQLLSKKPLEVEIKHSLKSEDALGKKTIRKFYQLKDEFLKSE
jgi:hypothetical protein